MSDASVHVNPVSDKNSIAEAEEAIRKASAAQCEALAGQAGAEEAQRHAQGTSESEMFVEVAAEASGLGGISSAISLFDDRRTDLALNKGLEEDGAKMGATNPVSFEGSYHTDQPSRCIQTEFEAPTVCERFNMATMTFASLKEDMSGAKASEDICDEMTALAECKQMMCLANENVLAGAKYTISSAPTFGGSGGHQMAIADRKSAQDELEAQRRFMQNQNPTQPPPPPVEYAQLKVPGMNFDLSKGPSGPTSDITTEESGALA